MPNESQSLDPMVRDMEVRYDRLFAGYAKSPTLRQIWRDAYGDDYPEDVEPLSYVTLTDLHRLVLAVAAGPGHTIADLGCGRGGPSLWVARQTGAHVVGIDVSSIGIAHANERADREGMTGQARFQVGDVTATGLPAASVDAAMSVDALVFVPDIEAVMAEVARILRPGGHFAFITREQSAPSTSFGTPSRPDYRPALTGAGLEIDTYEETPHWAERQFALLRAMAAAEPQLRAEMDAASVEEFMIWAQGRPPEPPEVRYRNTRRVFSVARKPR
jgi:ubiquinone/menaquinone biosynthesis C-methylase UbiE